MKYVQEVSDELNQLLKPRTKGRSISLSTKGTSDDSMLVQEWIDRFFTAEDGSIRNNLSGVIKRAIIICAYPHLGVTWDQRYTMPEEDKQDNARNDAETSVVHSQLDIL